MDECTTSLWFEKVWQPYVDGQPRSLLMLDTFSCHMQEKFHDKRASVGTEVELIPGGYTSILQPVDISIAAPFKRHLEHRHNNWCSEKYPQYEADTFLTPTCMDVHERTISAWDTIDSRSVAKTFASIGPSEALILVEQVAVVPM